VSANSKRAYQGINKLRRLLRKMDPEITQPVKDAIKQGAQAIEADMMMGAPVDEGDLQRSISYKLGNDGMSAYIGPGADRAVIRKSGFAGGARKYTKSGDLTRATIKDDDARFQLSKANWIEFGVKPHGNHPGRPAAPFLNPAFDANRDWILREVQGAIDTAIKQAAGNE